MKGIRAKIDTDEAPKIAKKRTKVQNKSKDAYKYVTKKDGKNFIKVETVKEFDDFEKNIKAVDSEINLLALRQQNFDLRIENLEKDIQILKRDKRDIEAAIFHKKTEKKKANILKDEFRTKVCREIGEGVSSFGYHPESLEIFTE